MKLNTKLLLEECETCAGKFARLTQGKDDDVPVRFCEACGKLLEPELPTVTKYDKTTGNVRAYTIVLRCESWVAPVKIRHWYGKQKKDDYFRRLFKRSPHTRLHCFYQNKTWNEEELD